MNQKVHDGVRLISMCSPGVVLATGHEREVDGVDIVDVMDTSATAIRSERRPVENTLYILAHGIALLAIADFGLRISDWVVGIGVRETRNGGWRLLECAFWVVHETRIQSG